jgi:hypothetical protein
MLPAVMKPLRGIKTRCVAATQGGASLALGFDMQRLRRKVIPKDSACCNYPRSTAAHFQQMLAAPSPGRLLRRNLYRYTTDTALPTLACCKQCPDYKSG